MATDDKDEAGRAETGKAKDPMGVWSRWGKRELWFLIASALAIGVVAVVASRHDLGRPASGPPMGVAPEQSPASVR